MKHIIFFTALTLSLFFFILWNFNILDGFFRIPIRVQGESLPGIVFELLTFFPIVLVFSTSFLLLPYRYFVRWWNFSQFAIPIVLLLVLGIRLELHSAEREFGFFDMSEAFDWGVILIIYAIFSLISLWIILRTYWKSRVGQSHTTG